MASESAKRDGFTLVELSVVLVVIGLMIGGILAGQSMISTAKVNSVAMQIGQFDAQVENFKTKYNYLPGDAPAYGGDGNGIIESSVPGFTANAINNFSCETANFWFSLDQQQFPGASACSGSGTQAISSGSTKNVPLSRLGSNNAFFIASALSVSGTVIANNIDPENYYALLAGSQIQTNTVPQCCYYGLAVTTSANSAVKPGDLLALDKKIDDGVANKGNVLSGNINAGNQATNGAIDISPLSTCNDAVTHTYQVQNNSYECTPLIRIGASAGDSK